MVVCCYVLQHNQKSDYFEEPGPDMTAKDSDTLCSLLHWRVVEPSLSFQKYNTERVRFWTSAVYITYSTHIYIYNIKMNSKKRNEKTILRTRTVSHSNQHFLGYYEVYEAAASPCFFFSCVVPVLCAGPFALFCTVFHFLCCSVPKKKEVEITIVLSAAHTPWSSAAVPHLYFSWSVVQA